MNSLSNYDDVFNQLQAFGLDITSLDYSGKMKRCKMVNGDRESRGWYILYEVPKTDGTGSFITGSFGVWQGADNNAQKVSLAKGVTLSSEQAEAIKARAAADKKKQDTALRFKNEKAAKEANVYWKKLSTDGEFEYLTRKQVGANGGRFSPRGNFAIPLQDEKGAIHGLQIIYCAADKAKKGRDKDFFPQGLAKKGHFYQIGTPTWIVFIAEGFATAASIHEATGLPVVVAFDAGNLQPVAQAIAKKYPKAKIVIACDDDYLKKCPKCKKYHLADVAECECGQKMPNGNPGVTMGKLAALAVSGTVVIPKFNDERPIDKKGPTDFNDIAVLEGPRVVEAQIADHLTAMGLQPVAPRAVATTQGGGVANALVIDDAEMMFGRFSLVYNGGSVAFDHDHHLLVPLGDVRDACTDKNFVRIWQADAKRRRIVKIEEVGFDPTEQDPKIKCNLWAGWPTSPEQGDCSELLDLLYYLVSNEDDKKEELYQWVLKWLAYPIQNHGAKMETALVFHGPQGTGKNLFFETIMRLYGEYGAIIDQSALEDKHNDWASRKLFVVADEVIARQEMHHIKNKLKAIVTGKKIRINPKNIKAYWESNHCNVVFLSNEAQPLVLERDDRRYVVIWTPPKEEKKFYNAIRSSLDNGGLAALHYHLLHHVNLDGFTPETYPPMTAAKAELINTSMDSWEQFAREWAAGQLSSSLIFHPDENGSPVMAADIETLFQLYRKWADRNGCRYVEQKNQFLTKISRLPNFMKRVAQHVQLGLKKSQLTIVYPPNHTLPPSNTTMSAWNSQQVERFIECISAVKRVFDD
ncbi:toprim domain-containing protein [Deefgea piscis]|uniref:Toprim domain-containing protein n=1 Tax=Deefgea piscis TaxID=2739061 RepID=A0A6M8SVZ7_9NEIS|nr:DUF5906 domain-containing protein [Deefgea piscis]QKJ67470.1 toprim domain-containing protein [Deefgea piscis]